MKKGFTLAEVLITLAVIIVIASITLPSIIQNSSNKRFEVARTKAKSSVFNGYKKMLSYYGLTNISDLPLWNCKTKECFSNEHKKVFSIVSDSLDDTVVANFNTKKMYGAAYALTFEQDYKMQNGSSKTVNWGELPYTFITNDGMIYGIKNIDYENNYSFDVVVDTNCSNNPNKVGTDYTEFTINAYAGTIEEKDMNEDSFGDDSDFDNGNNNTNENLEEENNNDNNLDGDKNNNNNNKDDNNNNEGWTTPEDNFGLDNDDDNNKPTDENDNDNWDNPSDFDNDNNENNNENQENNEDIDDDKSDEDNWSDDDDSSTDNDNENNDNDDSDNNKGKNCNGKGNPNCTGNVNGTCHGKNNPNCVPK